MKRVMIVEDNPGDVFLLKEALKARNIEFELMCFPDVPEAIERILDENAPVPDLILVDLNLPSGEGMEVLSAARNDPRLSVVPMAILTSSNSSIDEQAASALGIAECIHKPPGLAEFREQVGSAVSRLLDLPAGGLRAASASGDSGPMPR